MTIATPFADLGLKRELLTVLSALGYEEPTPIQREAIPLLLEGRDLLGQAATGTGKTAAFALPLIQALPPKRKNLAPMGLVLVPTRELAMQVATALHKYGRNLGVRVLPIYGGQPIVRQLRTLERGVDVVVATPGRALDHLRRKTLSLEELKTIVLDEADEMLDMGFAEDIESILSQAPTERQTLLFSATLPPRIRTISKKHLRNPVLIEIERKPVAAGEVPKVRQTAYVVSRPHKLSALFRILDVEAPAAALIFCRTRTEVDDLGDALAARGFRSEILHGGMSQEQRDKVMRRLHTGQADIMVATDVAARGLDIERLTHVINFATPSAPEGYVHRIGRVGRAGREGVAISLIEPREHRLLKNIEGLTRRKITIEKVPTVADLRSRRLEATRATLRDILVENEYQEFRVVLESLSDEFDPYEVALAAVKLAHQTTSAPVEEVDIPETAPPRDWQKRQDRSRGGRYKPERRPGPDYQGKPKRQAKPEYHAKPEYQAKTKAKPKKPAKSEQQAKPERKATPEQQAKPERKATPEQQAKPERKTTPEQQAKPERKATPEQQAKPERKATPERPATPERKAKAERPSKAAHQGKPERQVKAGYKARHEHPVRHGATEAKGKAPGRPGTTPRPVRGKGRPSLRMTRLVINAGHEAGVRPQDLVGAITAEAAVSGREIGAIEITERFSLVEVAEGIVPVVIDAVRRTRIKGRKVTARIEKPPRQ